MGLLDRVNEKANTSEGIGLKDGEIVECMLLEKSTPAKQRKEWNENEQAKKDNAAILGDLYEPKPASYKHCGIAWKLTVLRRNIDINEFGEVSNGELVYRPKDGKLEIPKYNVVTYFQHLPPNIIQTIESKNGFKYGDMFRMAGSDELDKEGKPIISTLYPSVNAYKENDKDIPYKERVSADNIPQGQEDKYKTLIEKDQERKEEWRSLINEYKEWSEEEASNYLDTCISRRLMLCNINQYAEEGATPEIIYRKPMKGMKFTAKITRNGKYFNIVVLANEKIRGQYTTMNYSTNQVELSTDKDKKIAQEILNAYEEYFANKRAKVEKVEEDDDEPDKF